MTRGQNKHLVKNKVKAYVIYLINRLSRRTQIVNGYSVQKTLNRNTYMYVFCSMHSYNYMQLFSAARFPKSKRQDVTYLIGAFYSFEKSLKEIRIKKKFVMWDQNCVRHFHCSQFPGPVYQSSNSCFYSSRTQMCPSYKKEKIF